MKIGRGYFGSCLKVLFCQCRCDAITVSIKLPGGETIVHSWSWGEVLSGSVGGEGLVIVVFA